MLRVSVGLLLLANLAFWAWHAGVLGSWGPAAERDPTRRDQQVRPDSVRVLPSTSSAPLPAPAGSPVSTAPAAPVAGLRASNPGTVLLAQPPASLPVAGLAGVCLEAGPWAAAGADEAERLLAATGLAPSNWQRLRLDVTAQYAVVLGPFNSRESMQAKREELGRLRLVAEELALPAEGSAADVGQRPGLALARYDARTAAEAGLAAYSQRGVRTARVSQLRSAGTEHRLRVPAAPPALAEQLRRFNGAAFGAGFQPCEGAR